MEMHEGEWQAVEESIEAKFRIMDRGSFPRVKARPMGWECGGK